MHNWWAEYDILMANYRAMFADNVCHNPDMLNASLAIIEAKIEKVPLTPMSTKPIKFVLTCRHLLNPKIGEMGLDLEGRAIGPH